MRTLFHLPLHAGSRIIRLLLTEKGLDFTVKSEQIWERREAFLRLNPSGEVPVLREPDGTAIAETTVIAEYVEEVYPERSMLGHDPLQRAEVRRIFSWFDRKFRREVTANLVDEKLMKRFLRMGQPNSTAIRAGHSNIHHHLDYIAWLAERRNWLAGEDVSLADLAAAAHLSAVDYLGDVPWEQHQGAKDWYARVKSRPSMRPILADNIPGMPPPKHYADLDF